MFWGKGRAHKIGFAFVLGKYSRYHSFLNWQVSVVMIDQWFWQLFSTTIATWSDGGILELPFCPAYIAPIWSLHASGISHTVSSLCSYNYWDTPTNRTLNILLLMLQYYFVASKVLLIISNELWNWANTLIEKCLKFLRLTFKL